MGSEQAREVLAVHAERHGYPLCAASVRKGDEPYFNHVLIEAMLSFATTAREQALREAAEIARAPHTGGEQCFRAAWDQVGQSIADRILSLLTKEPKA